ncbi:alpha/beta fold hydrolase [Aliinostoc sp. HNIBRCY26]|uniref:alpha/beta fold hydrolase n=1 Tax=Aliinostoc sp. HNIBRCY26 TaxID=3418997 RepID=UPI003D004061
MLNNLPAKMIELNGVEYFVRDSGTGEETVLLIHGWPDDGNLWKHQIIALLEHGYRVICPDLLGYGLSETPTDISRYQLANLVNDMISLLEKLAVTKVHCIAHDYGAVIGWELAAHTEKLQTFTAMSVGHLAEFLTTSLENVQFLWIYFLNIHDVAPQLYRVNNGCLLREVLRSHPHREEILDNTLKPGALENMQRLEKANPVPNYLLTALAGELPEPVIIPVPTLGIWGNQDEVLWESQMQNSGKYISADWQYEKITDAGHWFMLEKPQQVNQLLLNWLKKHSLELNNN